jgi:hypothetical protein
MTRPSSRWVARSLLAVFVVGTAVEISLGIPNGNLRGADAFSIKLAFGAFMIVGALIVARRPENSIGWVFSAIGVLAATGNAASEYAEYAYVTRPGSLPGALAAAWLANWYWLPLISLTLLFTVLLFPDGRPLSPRWRPVVWVGAISTAAVTVLATLNPTLRLQEEDFSVANPIGVPAVGNVEEGAVGGALLALLLLLIVAAFLSLVLRFRRSRGDERQQLKWFTYAGALVVLLVLGDELLPLPDIGLGDFLFGVVVALIPISAGIAILRYRLYDIDLVINRTLVYGALTALLGLVYVGSVVVLGGLLRPVAGSNDLAVAGSTLAVAALFAPARRRIQAFVDRRFYRSRYDAARTVEAFSSRLRDEVDLETLRADLTGVVRETLQPTSVSVWLREARAGR